MKSNFIENLHKYYSFSLLDIGKFCFLPPHPHIHFKLYVLVRVQLTVYVFFPYLYPQLNNNAARISNLVAAVTKLSTCPTRHIKNISFHFFYLL